MGTDTLVEIFKEAKYKLRQQMPGIWIKEAIHHNIRRNNAKSRSPLRDSHRDDFRCFGKMLGKNTMDAFASVPRHIIAVIANRNKSRFKTHAIRWMQDLERVMDGTWQTPNEILCVKTNKSIHTLFVHISEKDPGKLAYYESEDKFLRDIQTQIAPARWYKKVHPEATDEDLRDFTKRFTENYGEADFKSSDKEEDFVRVYQNGPDSCMKFSETDPQWHPARVYAAGDIEILWLERNERITARCLANRMTKAVSRIYGDAVLMKRYLKLNGYAQKEDALNGCKLLEIITATDDILMPYIDRGGDRQGATHVRKTATGFVIDSVSGTHHANTTDTVLAEPNVCCCCGCPISDEEEHDIENEDGSDGTVCLSCFERYYVEAIYDEHENTRYIHVENSIYCEEEDQNYSIDYANIALKHCQRCFNWVKEVTEPQTELWIGKKLCHSCLNETDGEKSR